MAHTFGEFYGKVRLELENALNRLKIAFVWIFFRHSNIEWKKRRLSVLLIASFSVGHPISSELHPCIARFLFE
jgi:hypothetical protein